MLIYHAEGVAALHNEEQALLTKLSLVREEKRRAVSSLIQQAVHNNLLGSTLNTKKGKVIIPSSTCLEQAPTLVDAVQIIS